ncbi:unnamed protein product, partial [marine sediment metagenome]
RNPDNEIPLIYLASSYGHLGRMAEAEAAIEAANDVRARHGKGDLSLERQDDTGLRIFSPFEGEIDFNRFGGEAAQKRLRAGLSQIPALTWQYLITTQLHLTPEQIWIPSYEIEGATEIDLATAKSFTTGASCSSIRAMRRFGAKGISLIQSIFPRIGMPKT